MPKKNPTSISTVNPSSNEYERLLAKNNALEAALAEAEAAKETLKQKEQALEDLTRSAIHWNTENDKLKKSLEQTQKELKDSQFAIQHLTQASSEFKAQVDAQITLNHTLQTQLASQQSAMDTANELIKKTRLAHQETENNLTKANKDLRAQIENAKLRTKRNSKWKTAAYFGLLALGTLLFATGFGAIVGIPMVVLANIACWTSAVTITILLGYGACKAIQAWCLSPRGHGCDEGLRVIDADLPTNSNPQRIDNSPQDVQKKSRKKVVSPTNASENRYGLHSINRDPNPPVIEFPPLDFNQRRNTKR